MFSTATITANGVNTKCAQVERPNGLTNYAASIYVTGAFGGGTVSLFVSPDGGTTLVPLKDESGTAITALSAEVFFIQLGGGTYELDADRRFETIWASMAGGAAQNVTITVNSNE